MNIPRLIPALLLFLSVCTQAADEEARKIVEQYLAEHNAQTARVHIMPITDETVSSIMPSHVCFAVLFPQFPVGIAAPAPLKSSNILAVKNGKVEAITDMAQLETFMKDNLKPVTNEREARAAAYTWLRLSQELHQDGFLKFSIPETELAGDTNQASGKLVVEQNGGNKGDLSVTLRFSKGKLITAEEKGRIRPGIRPICQATKLTDPDPIVRKMAEKDILVMGRSCREYLDEQRAKASPEVQQAIDRIWQKILDEDW